MVYVGVVSLLFLLSRTSVHGHLNSRNSTWFVAYNRSSARRVSVAALDHAVLVVECSLPILKSPKDNFCILVGYYILLGQGLSLKIIFVLFCRLFIFSHVFLKIFSNLDNVK